MTLALNLRADGPIAAKFIIQGLSKNEQDDSNRPAHFYELVVLLKIFNLFYNFAEKFGTVLRGITIYDKENIFQNSKRTQR